MGIRRNYLVIGFIFGLLLFLLIESLIILFVEKLGLFGIGLSWLFLIPIKLIFIDLNIVFIYLFAGIFYGLLGLIISYFVFKIKKGL